MLAVSYDVTDRLGATGELQVELHSLSGLQEAGEELTHSKYFSRERTRCEFEIGIGRIVLFLTH